MAKLGRGVGRRVGFWGIAVAIWEIWKRVPPKHRRRLLRQARRYGLSLTKLAYKAWRNRRLL